MNQKQRVLITGATSGIGRATAEAFASRGYSLLLCGRRADSLSEFTKLLSQKFGVQAEHLGFDISDRKSVEGAFSKANSLLSEIKILVNNAGLSAGTQKFDALDFDDVDRMIDTNVKGLIFLTRIVLPHMIKANHGHIVNIGSVNGRWCYPNSAVYGATKFAVRALSESLRLDLHGSAIRITNIEPGVVDTKFWETRFQDKAKADEFTANWQPLQPTDISDAIVWSVERPAHVNIQEMVIFPTQQVVGGIAKK